MRRAGNKTDNNARLRIGNKAETKKAGREKMELIK